MTEHRDTAASPYAELFRASVNAAHGEGASVIHIGPTREGVDIRFRVFGEMKEPWKRLSLEHKQSFLVAVKKETRLQIGVSGRPQDSRCNVSGLAIDLRVSLLPTLFGEKIVLRLLDTGREFGIDSLGIPDKTLADLLNALSFRNGVVLISGPTGSGKTTTLYSLLGAIDRVRKNIVTLEDPVEYTIGGISQVKIDPKVTFSAALRAVLRQDPDVILVGEIRDEETANLAFRAAATGHLVLSTVHANGAAEVTQRLLNLGIDKDTLRDNLRFSAAQRLVPKLCPLCAVNVEGSYRQKNEVGCQACTGGVVGRLPVIEYLTRERIVDYLDGRGGRAEPSLFEAAEQLAREGLIDMREVSSIG